MKLSVWQKLRLRAYLFAVGIKRRMTLGTRVALIGEGRVLLVRQTYLPGWHFPGGGVEPGETAATAAAREVLEETGCRITGALRLHGLFHNLSSVTNRDHIAFFVAEDFEQAAAFRPNLEIAECRWFPLDAPPADATPPTARRMAELRGGLAPDARW